MALVVEANPLQNSVNLETLTKVMLNPDSYLDYRSVVFNQKRMEFIFNISIKCEFQ